MPASGPPRIPPALRALAEVGRSLVEGSTSGRLLLARLAGVVAPEQLPAPLRDLDAATTRARNEAAVPLRAKTVEKTLKDAWGEPPHAVVEGLDADAPAVVTPVAQVHRARIDGRPVAVKVRRPGLEAALRADLALLDLLRPPLAALLPETDTGALVAAIKERALDELDLLHEAEQERAAGRALRGTPGVEVPAVHLDLSGPAVKVTGWLEGPTLAQDRPQDPRVAARAIVAAHVDATRAGLVLTDARPNHVVLLPDGGIGLLGTGKAVAVDRRRIAAQIAEVTALRDRDRDRDVGAVAAPADELIRAIAGDLLDGPARLDAAALAGAAERALARLDDVVALAGGQRLEPQDLWLARGTGQLVAVLARLEADEDWARLLDPATASRAAGTARADRRAPRP